MEVSYSGSNVTVQDGLVCIRGRFIEEDSSTTLSTGTDSSYCKLVIEVDLDKENTEDLLMQASYKIVKSTSGYPNLTQTDIAKNKSGIYQYELAKFRTSTSGIFDFQDMRTFIDFDSIYEEIRQKIESIEKTSDFVFKSDINIITAKQSRGTININQTWTRTQIPLSEAVQVGTKLIFGANRVIVGKGVSKVLISAGTSGINDSIAGDKSFAIRINNEEFWNCYQSGRNSNFFQSQSISNVLAEVEEGDIIDISLASSNAGNIEHLGFYLTVQIVE